jgi:hypothetical protein
MRIRLNPRLLPLLLLAQLPQAGFAATEDHAPQVRTLRPGVTLTLLAEAVRDRLRSLPQGTGAAGLVG